MQAICFDLDDTLFDYHEYARAGLRAAADRLHAQTGLQLHDELQAMYFDEGITDHTFDRLLDRYDLPDHLIDDLVNAYHGSDSSLEPYQHAEPVLTALDKKYLLGLVTDGKGGHAKLDRLGLGQYFDAVLVTPTIGTSKRETAPFEQILADLSVDPGAAVYVGDDPRFDFEAPNVLGMTTIRLRRGRYTDLDPASEAAAPDHEIDRLDRLAECL